MARLAGQLTGRRWRDKNGAERSMEPADILIVTPYNAQIRAIQRALAGIGQTGFRVGTVDKFQGQEAPAVIYSMATSSADEAPRGLDFLYDPHRLNVATSRARALAIIVASPDLIRVSCRTPHQMVLANALCRAWETVAAETAGSGALPGAVESGWADALALEGFGLPGGDFGGPGRTLASRSSRWARSSWVRADRMLRSMARMPGSS